VHVSAGQLAAAGHEVLVCVDRKSMRPRPLPPELRRLLEPFALDEDGARRQLGVAPGGPR
jgi:acyl-CoA thioesterase FadM